VADEILEDREDVPTVAYDAFEKGAECWFLARFTVPFCEHCGRHLYVAPQLFRGVASQEEPIEKGSLSLRELEVLQLLV
jgi:hypothetical protein